MKICILELQPFPYNIGGGTTHIIDLSKYLIKKGHEVAVITSKPGNNQKALKTPLELKVYNVGIPHQIFKKTSAVITLLMVVKRLRWELTWILAAKKKLKEINPDICNPQSLISTALPCSLSHKKFVATQHGTYLSGFRKLWKERRSIVAYSLSYLYYIIENFNAKRADHITCVGKDTYRYYKQFGKKKCSIIPHGVDFDNFKDIDFTKKKGHLFVGRLTEQKGFSYLINALEILDKQGINLELNVAGEGEEDYVGPIKKRAESFKNVKVNFLGFVTGKRLYQLYEKTRVFISSSIFEPFGIVLTEAMASGCAIISADHEGSRLLVKKEYGKIVDYSDQEKRAKNLAKAINGSLKWDNSSMGKKAREEAKKYSYENLAGEYLNIFNQAIRKNGKT